MDEVFDTCSFQVVHTSRSTGNDKHSATIQGFESRNCIFSIFIIAGTDYMNAHKINGVPRTGASATEGGLETVVENSVDYPLCTPVKAQQPFITRKSYALILMDSTQYQHIPAYLHWHRKILTRLKQFIVANSFLDMPIWRERCSREVYHVHSFSSLMLYPFISMYRFGISAFHPTFCEHTWGWS